jgi:hypothetical protein
MQMIAIAPPRGRRAVGFRRQRQVKSIRDGIA